MTFRDKLAKQYKLNTRTEVGQRYEDRQVVSEYISKRFRKPVGKMKHNAQVQIINDAILETNPKKVLELACGPARLTVDIEGNFKGIATDFSDEMLKVSKSRARYNKNWIFKKMDVFKPNLGNQKFDLIFGFRFIRHFKPKDRKKLYSNTRKLMAKDGLLILDVVNAKKAKWIKLVGGKKRLVTYDKLYYRDEILKELKENKLEVLKIYPIVNHFFIQYSISEVMSKLRLSRDGYNIVNLLEKIGVKNNPWEWVVVCRKK